MTYKKAWAEHIEDGLVNRAIAEYHAKRPGRVQTCASPSTLTECPRVVWLKKHKVKPPIPLGWGKAQRMMQGRVFEDVIAKQLKESGNLLHHWSDNEEDEPVKFEMGEGENRIAGTPDLLIKEDDTVYISDAKTSMGKSFAYVPTTIPEVWEDYLWFKYQLQVETYYMLCHKNADWFKKNGLLLPNACHLFSYALDDGINRREFKWKATKDTAAKILYYAKRWNQAYASETMPACTCNEFDGTPKKFCYYVTKQEATQSGYKLGVECCTDELGESAWKK